MKNAFILGLTGQTGCGKSLVCSYLKKMGAFIIDADVVACNVMSADDELKSELADAFGKDIIIGGGMLNRPLLASRAFKSEQNTELLNSICHPRIIKEIENIINCNKKENNIIIVDAPALFESGADRLCDNVACIVADENVRLKRIIERDNLSEFDAKLRIKAQKDVQFYVSKSDIVLENNAGDDVRDLANRIYKFIEGRQSLEKNS